MKKFYFEKCLNFRFFDQTYTGNCWNFLIILIFLLIMRYCLYTIVFYLQAFAKEDETTFFPFYHHLWSPINMPLLLLLGLHGYLCTHIPRSFSSSTPLPPSNSIIYILNHMRIVEDRWENLCLPAVIQHWRSSL